MNRRHFLEAAVFGSGIKLTTTPMLSQGTFSSLGSADGYLRSEGNRWIMGTSRAEKTIALDHGRIQLASFKNKISGREYIQQPGISDEIFFLADGREV